MEQKTFNINELLYNIRRRLKIILIITLLSTIVATLIATFMMKPKYQATARIFVGKEADIRSDYTKEELATNRELMSTYIEIVKTEDILNKALAEAGIKKTAMEITNNLSFIPNGNAPIFEIKYLSGDKDEAREVVDAVSKEFGNQVNEIILNAYTKIIDSVKVVTMLPEKNKVIIMGAMLGLLLSLIVVLVLDYLDNTVKNRDDLEKLVGIPVIGSIPNQSKSRKLGVE